MKKTKLLLVILAAVLWSCSDENNGTTPPLPNTVDVIVSDSTNSMAQAVDSDAYNILGHGYDATGLYYNALSGRALVVDVAEIQATNPDDIVMGFASYSGNNFTNGLSLNGLIHLLSRNATPYDYETTEEVENNKFSDEIKLAFGEDITKSNKYTYGIYEWTACCRNYYIYSSTQYLKNHLTDEFQADLQTKSPEFIVQKYGTHVMTSIQLGGRLQALYRSYILPEYDNDKEWISSMGMSAALTYALGVGFASGSKSTIALNKEQKLYVRSIGGSNKVRFEGIVNQDTATVPAIDINPWVHSITTNPSFIMMDSNDLIPIFDFASDSTQRAALKNAYENYFLSKKIPD